ncbi:MAG TPA: flagellar hook-basal body complex protein FliE [Rhodocyclaceae bacterium]|nr:flagellar hook-basal body complex protein FliE [Rhodocyclaceae bacterium]
MGIEVASAMGAQIRADLAGLQNSAQGMGMPALNALGAEGAESGLAAGESAEAGTGFADSMKQVLQSVNEQDRVAGERMADVDSGRSDDLVGAMLSSQEANLSFSMLMQVRNKVVGAMDELIKLQL